MTHGSSKRQTGKFEPFVVHQHALGVVVTVELTRQILEVEGNLVRRVVSRSVLDDFGESRQAGAQGQLALVVETAQIGIGQIGEDAVPLAQHRAQAASTQ